MPTPETTDALWTRVTWAALGLFAIALLLVVLGPHRVGDSFAESDFYGGYVEGARALQRLRIDPSRYGVVGPGYELALALLGAIVRDLFVAAEVLSLASVCLALGLWARIFRERGGSRLACLATLFLVVNPILFRYGYSATNDAFTFALQTGSMAALLLGSRRRAFVAAGTLAATAFLTRYTSLVLLPVGLAAIALRATRAPGRRAAALCFAAAFFGLVVPWVAFTLSSGQKFAFQFHHNIAFDVFARSKGIPWDDYQEFLQPQFRSLADVIAKDPLAVLRREGFNFYDHLRSDLLSLLGIPVAVCVVIGAAVVVGTGMLARFWPVALWWGLLFLSLVPFFSSERYSIPLLPFYALLAAAPFTWGRFVNGSPLRVRTASILAALPLAFSAAGAVAATRIALDHLPRETVECGAFLREHAGKDDRVICRKAHVAYYGRVQAVPFPFAHDIADLAAFAQRSHARWLYFSRFEADLRPAFLYLLDTTAVVPGLIPRWSSASPAILYEIDSSFGSEAPWMRNDTLLTLHAMRARIRVRPDDLDALLSLGQYDLDRDAASAARWLERARAAHPGSTQAWLLLGHARLETGDPAGAGAAYRRVLSLQPDDLVARLGMGWASLAANDLPGAGRWWRPIVGSTRDAPSLLRMIAVYGALGDSLGEAEARRTLAGLSDGR